MSYLTDLLTTLHNLPWLFYTYVTIFGLMVGSFLNVVIYRLPVMMERQYEDDYNEYFHPDKEPIKRDKFNLMTPRSRCPNCGHKITAWENIPVISWLCLRGKCSGCKQPISIRYPLVEAFTALVSFVVAYHFGPTTQMIGALILTWSLVALAGIDYDKMLLPDEIVLPLLWIGILFNVSETYVPLTQSIYGAVAGYLILWSFYWVFKLITGKEGMGYGDFKLTACLGAWFGLKMLPAIIMGSACFGAVIGITYMICTRNKASKPIPFGPYIAMAGYAVMLYGQEINNWYLKVIMG